MPIEITMTADTAGEMLAQVRQLFGPPAAHVEVAKTGYTPTAADEGKQVFARGEEIVVAEEPKTEEPKRRGRPKKAAAEPEPAPEPEPDEAEGQTEPEEDNIDEALVEEAVVATATRDDVKASLMAYFKKFGEKATVESAPKLMGAEKVSLLPEDPEGFGRVKAALDAAVAAGKPEGA